VSGGFDADGTLNPPLDPATRSNRGARAPKRVRGVAAIARELSLKTIAEGVEDAVTYPMLGDYRIDPAQGFLLGQPTAVADAG
jgi:EAL domain-containing protein (putative c-di-GMP-specific phosphodiesterase class I)